MTARTFLALPLACALVGPSLGCSTTITLRDGREVVGRAVRGDAEHLWVRQDQTGHRLEPAELKDATPQPVTVTVDYRDYGGPSRAEGVLSAETRVTRTSEAKPALKWARVCLEGPSVTCIPGEDVESVRIYDDVRLRRSEIAHVQYPGTTAMIVGAILAAASLPLIVYGSVNRSPEPESRQRFPGELGPNLDKNVALGVGVGALVGGAIVAGAGGLSYYGTKASFP